MRTLPLIRRSLLLAAAAVVSAPVALPVRANVAPPDQRPQSVHAEEELRYRGLDASAYPATPDNVATVSALSDVGARSIEASSPQRFTVGFAPYWMNGSWQNYRWETLSQVAYFRTLVNYDGHLVYEADKEPPADLIATAHAHGVEVLLTFFPVDTNALNKELLASPTYYRRAAQEMVDKVMAVGADGINVDFELVDDSRRAAFTDFVREVATRLEAARPGSTVSVDVPAIDWDEAYDEAALAQYADWLLLMAYDYWWQGSGDAGPVAPLFDTAWRANYSADYSISQLLTTVPAEKVVMGVPWYGRKWSTAGGGVPATTTGSVGALYYHQAADEAAAHGRNWYPSSQVPYVKDASGGFQTWYDDFESLSAKFNYAVSKGLHGVGVWALGYDGGRPELWDSLQAYASPVPDTLQRLAGLDRYGTAAAISRDSFPTDDSAQCVVLATGENWPDALGGSVLARACNGPLLLTKSSDLLAATADEVARVLPPGGLVHLLGGESALAAEVANDLTGLGFTVQRIAGANRTETAANIANSINNGPDSVVIGTSENFPDLLSIGAPAAERLYPVLLTTPNTLSAATRDFLTGPRAANVKTVYIAGGRAAVDGSASDELVSLGFGVVRLAGADRYGTSAAIAEHFASTATSVSLATGATFADGLTGAAHAAANHAAVLLVESATLPPASWAYLEEHGATIVDGHVYGGFAAVSRAVQDVAQTLITP